ncbi:hypothetical protein [Variovorax ginsengisoli]|uniref:Lipoprotein n=1 Tax=Variovorax ginsengisoli TaxID=363844 RepID=A0ABT9S647_9BURK|nr:hypothetical protein [Variovorax ginsengisoli]MDP9899832.1 hypothetical protein [Variovorax ginsengisoli]
MPIFSAVRTLAAARRPARAAMTGLCLCAVVLSSGCAVVAVGGAVVSVAGTAVSVGASAVGLAADAAIGTARLGGRAVGAVLPGGGAAP